MKFFKQLFTQLLKYNILSRLRKGIKNVISLFHTSVTLSFVLYFSVALYIFYICTLAVVVVALLEKGVAHEWQPISYYLFCHS